MKCGKAKMKFSDMLLHAWPYYQALYFPENHSTLPELYVADANWPQQMRLIAAKTFTSIV